MIGIVLAAGEASRMGRPKQVLRHPDGRALVVRAAEEVRASGFTPLVVLGAHADVVESALPTSVARVRCVKWAEGMGASIRCGLSEALKYQPEALLITLADLVEVKAQHYRALVHASKGHDIAAATFSGQVGVPACFRATTYGSLLKLPTNRGAKLLLNSPTLNVARVPMDVAARDIDTPEEWEAFHTRRALQGGGL